MTVRESNYGKFSIKGLKALAKAFNLNVRKVNID
jgi:hypothetical protein